ncbi:MAG: SAM-dependent methyltransferase [Mycobacterium sp.]
MTRLPDGYFEGLYSSSDDPWSLASRWYEQRKYAITLAMLPRPRYRHAFEPGCSVGVLTEQLTHRCERVTATDVAAAALDATGRRLEDAGRRDQVKLLGQSVDAPWPREDFDLVVLSEVGYYLSAQNLRDTLGRECRMLADTTVIAAHWRHPVADYLMPGDVVHQVISDTAGLHHIGRYRDSDVVIEVFDTATGASVAQRTHVPGVASAGPEPAGG